MLTGQGVVAFWHEGKVHAVDNRCPHLGFPLSKGTVRGGILTCHWHSWQFDLCSGGCLTPTESDVAVYPTKVEKDEVWVDLKPLDKSALLARSKSRLDNSLRVASSLEASKACFRLLKEGGNLKDLVRAGGELGTRFQSQFSAGMVTLTAIARVLGEHQIDFNREETVLGLIHGLSSVAGETQGTAPRRFRASLPSEGVSMDRLKAWFRGFLEDREIFAAERTLRTAFASGATREQIADMLLAAVTDHVFIGTGHVLDFANKAFELLDATGWDQAPDVLTAMIPDIANATRHEEEMAWKHPHDLIGLMQKAVKDTEKAEMVPAKPKKYDPWEWGEVLVAAEPEDGMAFLADKLNQGYGLVAVAEGLAAGSVLRMHRFHTRNEFFDWDTLHHLLTHANGFLKLARRFPSVELSRNAFQCYGYLYLCRFLNLPHARMPEEGKEKRPQASQDALWKAVEARQVEEAALQVHQMLLNRTHAVEVKKMLALAAFREDHGFHTWQQLDASFSLYDLLPDKSGRALSSLARWLAAHSPTPREMSRTVDNAIRLERGDKLYED
jgi:nitrite reductase/ring-hydroxylating ferredoxin subunit